MQRITQSQAVPALNGARPDDSECKIRVETVENPIQPPPTSLKRGVNENLGKAGGMAVDGIRFVVMFQNNIAQ